MVPKRLAGGNRSVSGLVRGTGHDWGKDEAWLERPFHSLRIRWVPHGLGLTHGVSASVSPTATRHRTVPAYPGRIGGGKGQEHGRRTLRGPGDQTLPGTVKSSAGPVTASPFEMRPWASFARA